MKDLWGIASNMLRRSRKMTRLIRAQFFTIFLVIFLLVSLLYKNQEEMDVLKEQIGEDVWEISPGISNFSGSSEKWTELQLDWLEEKYPDKVGLIEFSPRQEGKIQEVYLNNVISDLLLNPNSGEKVRLELLQLFVDEQVIESNIEILTVNEFPLEAPFVFLVGVDDDDMEMHSLNEELNQLNPNYTYYAKLVIQSKEQNTEINLVYIKSILFFVTISFLLIVTSIISFILLQNQYQKAKLQAFKLFGATNKDITKIFVFTNLLLVGPPYITVLTLFTVISVVSLTLQIWLLTFLISSLILIILIVFMTLPLMSLNKNS